MIARRDILAGLPAVALLAAAPAVAAAPSAPADPAAGLPAAVRQAIEAFQTSLLMAAVHGSEVSRQPGDLPSRDRYLAARATLRETHQKLIKTLSDDAESRVRAVREAG